MAIQYTRHHIERNESPCIENRERAVQNCQTECNADQYSLQLKRAPLLAVWHDESFVAKHSEVLIVQLVYQVCCLLVIVFLPLVRGVFIMLVILPTCMHTALMAHFNAVGWSAIHPSTLHMQQILFGFILRGIRNNARQHS